MSEQPQDLTPTMQEMMAQMSKMRAELDSLKLRAQTLPQIEEQVVNPAPLATITSTRRKTLKRLGLALLGGASAATLLDGVTVQARFIANPTINGLTNRAGAVILPPGALAPIGNPPSNYGKYGLIACGDTTDALNIDNLPNGNTGVYGIGGENGVYGRATGSGTISISNSIKGVSGSSIGSGNLNSYGVYGGSSSTSSGASYGVYGSGYTNGSGASYGVYGYGYKYSSGADGTYGVYGYGTNSTGPSTGVYGEGATYGIHGKSSSLAGYFEGNVVVSGTLSAGYLYKPGGTFKIDHPLDPENKYLSHSFVESPDMMNIYNGNVILDEQGEASVEMPDWFEALNMDFRYQLTALGQAAPDLHICQEINRGMFKIGGGLPGQRVSWMVTGVRQDAWANDHRVQVEETKSENEKGKFLYPQGFGKSEEWRCIPNQ